LKLLSIIGQDVDGTVLLQISMETMKADIGVPTLGERVKIHRAIEELRAKWGLGDLGYKPTIASVGSEGGAEELIDVPTEAPPGYSR
jgi:hypothetical protein